MTGPREDVWIGVDIGTQSVRVLAVQLDGTVVGRGDAPLSSKRDGGCHEQDPREWWTAVAQASRQALRRAPAPAVRGVAVAGTSGTVLLVDASGRPVSPALMYDDARARDHVSRVNDAGSELWSQLGYRRMQAPWALPKLLWLLEEYGPPQPGMRLAHQVDVVTRGLAGRDVPTDLSNALKTGADLLRECWPAEILDALHVPAHLLPDLVRPGAPLGTVCAAAAESTGIPVGTPMVAGATDGYAARLGAGALEIGSWNCVLGTTMVFKGVTPAPVLDPLGAVYSHKGPNGEWFPGGASNVGAGIVARDFGSADLGELDHQAATHEPASVVTYPLVARGERFPFVAPDATSFWLGHPANSGERYAALLQGVAFVERLSLDYLDYLGVPANGRYVVTGGATRSAYWCQLRADVLGRPLVLPDNAESALGMALLAASVDRTPAETAATMVRVREIVEPRSGVGERFDAPYLRLVDQLEQRGWLDAGLAEHSRERTLQ